MSIIYSPFFYVVAVFTNSILIVYIKNTEIEFGNTLYIY